MAPLTCEMNTFFDDKNIILTINLNDSTLIIRIVIDVFVFSIDEANNSLQNQ